MYKKGGIIMKKNLYNKREQEILDSITIEQIVSNTLIMGKYEGENYIYDTRENTINFKGVILQLRENNKIYNRLMEIMKDKEKVLSIDYIKDREPSILI